MPDRYSGPGRSPVLPFSWSGFRRGVAMALPVMLGYFPVGFAFGVLAVSAGIPVIAAGLMSVTVYAGSGQLIAADLAGAGVSVFSIILTTFVVNLRHLLMSAAVSPYLAGCSKPWQAFFTFEMTDETFALHMARFATHTPDRGEMLGLNTASHGMWIFAGFMGALFGDLFTDVRPYGLDYALSGMFIALLLPHFRVPRRLAAGGLAAALAVFFTLNGAADWSAILATAISATVIVVFSGSTAGERHD